MANIVEVAAAAGNFETLLAVVEAAGLTQTLAEEGPFTVFAPTDEAFAQLSPATVNTLLQNTPQLGRILLYHVVPGSLSRAELLEMKTLNSAEGSPIPVREGDGLEVKNATAIATDIAADNGTIHVIDRVILMG
ncbi:fasciclin domain-containing protein [Synechococcus sp. PCC 7336]|uniref:fasciclin domain-containing protein n=1 Tax=Synechococcus sp. PCC 7336 TaxID=195250 RepID=UPI000345DC0C|nr:fasciclin domain-containing protein [Synechococcus sp. PCC 7336]